MSRHAHAEEEVSGHVVLVACDGQPGDSRHVDSAFVVDESGMLHVWRVDGTQVTVYPPGQWRRVTATGQGLGP